MAKYPKFKAYFYNGFGKPRLLTTSVTGLLRDVHVSDSYTGDETGNVRELVRFFKNGKLTFEELKIELELYDIYIDPTRKKFIEASRTWFGNDIPFYHFVDFPKQEVYRIYDCQLDTFKEGWEDTNKEKLERDFIEYLRDDLDEGSWVAAEEIISFYEYEIVKVDK